MYRWAERVVLSCLVLCPAAANAGADYHVRWQANFSTPLVWPPAASAGKVVVQTGNRLEAFHLDAGAKSWSREFSFLGADGDAVAVSDSLVFVAGPQKLHRLRLSDGSPQSPSAFAPLSQILFAHDTLYAAEASGVLRLDRTGQKVLHRAKSLTGKILGAQKNHVVLFVRKPDAAPNTSPDRLIVLDLEQDKKAYQFKLLPRGGHRLVHVQDGKVAFIDYSRNAKGAQNPQKLFYTEADFVHSKKLKDISLSKKYPVAKKDAFWITEDQTGRLFLANVGPLGLSSTLFAFNPQSRETLWTRSGFVASTGMAFFDGLLWTAYTDKDRQTFLAAYDPADGNTVFRHPLDGPVLGPPLVQDQNLLLGTEKALYCFAKGKEPPKPADAPATPPLASGEKQPPVPVEYPGWRLYRDLKAGYFIQLPRQWAFKEKKMRKLGGLRFVIPFEREGMAGGRKALWATVYLMTWEARGRDASQVWQAIWSQLKKKYSEVKVWHKSTVKNVGGGGTDGLLVEYSYRDTRGYPMRMRTLCLVHHGVAFQLRGWVGMTQAKKLWRQIGRIFGSFVPYAFSQKKS